MSNWVNTFLLFLGQLTFLTSQISFLTIKVKKQFIPSIFWCIEFYCIFVNSETSIIVRAGDHNLFTSKVSLGFDIVSWKFLSSVCLHRPLHAHTLHLLSVSITTHMSQAIYFLTFYFNKDILNIKISTLNIKVSYEPW